MEKKKNSQESSGLAELFKKYRIEQYFWRNYKDAPRIQSLIKIMVVLVVSVILAIIFCASVLPK